MATVDIEYNRLMRSEKVSDSPSPNYQVSKESRDPFQNNLSLLESLVSQAQNFLRSTKIEREIRNDFEQNSNLYSAEDIAYRYRWSIIALYTIILGIESFFGTDNSTIITEKLLLTFNVTNSAYAVGLFHFFGILLYGGLLLTVLIVAKVVTDTGPILNELSELQEFRRKRIITDDEFKIDYQFLRRQLWIKRIQKLSYIFGMALFYIAVTFATYMMEREFATTVNTEPIDAQSIFFGSQKDITVTSDREQEINLPSTFAYMSIAVFSVILHLMAIFLPQPVWSKLTRAGFNAEKQRVKLDGLEQSLGSLCMKIIGLFVHESNEDQQKMMLALVPRSIRYEANRVRGDSFFPISVDPSPTHPEEGSDWSDAATDLEDHSTTTNNLD